MHIFFQNRGSQRGMICPLRDIWQCLGTFLVVTTLWGRFYRHLVGKARGTAKHPIMHRTGLTAENYVSVQNVKSARMEKLCPASLRPTQSLANKGVFGHVYCTEKKKSVYLGNREELRVGNEKGVRWKMEQNVN